MAAKKAAKKPAKKAAKKAAKKPAKKAAKKPAKKKAAKKALIGVTLRRLQDWTPDGIASGVSSFRESLVALQQSKRAAACCGPSHFGDRDYW